MGIHRKLLRRNYFTAKTGWPPAALVLLDRLSNLPLATNQLERSLRFQPLETMALHLLI